MFMDLSSLLARFMGPTWGPSGASRTQVSPMLAPWTLLSGICMQTNSTDVIKATIFHTVATKTKQNNAEQNKENILHNVMVILSHPGLDCFLFVSAASASAAAKTFPSHVKTFSAKHLIFGTKHIWVWGNVLNDLSMTVTQGHGCGID